MSKLLDWLEEDEWTQFAHARDEKGKSVVASSIEAVQWDLTGAIWISFRKDETDRAHEAILRLKKAYKILYPEYWKANEGDREPTLAQLNDELTSFAEVKRLLSMA